MTDKLPNIENIGSNAFNATKVSGELNFPNLKTLGSAAFSYTKISSIKSLGTVTSMSGSWYIPTLTSIELPENLEVLGGFGTWNINQENLVYDVTNLPKSIRTLEEYAFGRCINVTGTVNLPNLKGKLSSAFNNTKIERVENLGNLTELGDAGGAPGGSFAGCRQLVSCVLPETLTKIGSSSFQYCSALESINLPDSLTTIGESAFSGCSALKLDITNCFKNSTSIASDSFVNLTGVTGVVNMPICEIISGFQGTKVTGIGDISSATKIGDNAFYNCEDLTYDVTNLPKAITRIGWYAFKGCTKVTGIIDLPNLTGVMPHATFWHTGISEIRNLGTITELTGDINGQHGCFNGCTSLVKVTLPESLITIGENTFNSCSGVKKFDIPQSVTTIGANAFINCTSLSVFICRAITPPTMASSFTGSSADLKIYVPDDSVEAYKQASGWSEYAEKIFVLSSYVDTGEDGGIEVG